MIEKSKLRIRKYRAADRAQVREICFLTGLFGSSVEKIYGDRESFADMFTGYYTDVEPESAFVVVPENADDVVKGYFLGCVDSRKAWDPALVGAKHALLRGLIFRRSTAPFFFRVIWDVIRDGGVHRTPIDFDRYPAHFHTNLLPEARGGVGLSLHAAFIAELRARGVRGAHLELVAQNTRTLGIVTKLGYQPLGESFPLPGMRDDQGRRIRGMALGIDLDDLRPFAGKPVPHIGVPHVVP